MLPRGSIVKKIPSAFHVPYSRASDRKESSRGEGAFGSLETLALAWVAAIEEEARGKRKQRKKGKWENRENEGNAKRDYGSQLGGQTGKRATSLQRIPQPPLLPFPEEMSSLKGVT